MSLTKSSGMSKNSSRKIYNKDYFSVHMIGGYEAQATNPTFAKRISEFKALGFDNGTVLDIGCAYGYFMSWCEKLGYKTVGIDVAPSAIKKAKLVTKSPLYCLSVGEGTLPLKKNSIEIITLFNTLEHLENYSQALRECFRVLAPHGLLYIYVPTEPRWLTDVTHRNYFTVKTLPFVLKQFGFSVIKIGEEGGRWRNVFGAIRWICARHTRFNFIPTSTGAFVSCFAVKDRK